MIKITIEMTCEDLTDVKSHLSMAREQIIQAIKSNPDSPESPISHEGVNSRHIVTIETT